jgi:hypothetical protein
MVMRMALAGRDLLRLEWVPGVGEEELVSAKGYEQRLVYPLPSAFFNGSTRQEHVELFAVKGAPMRRGAGYEECREGFAREARGVRPWAT